MLSETFKLLFNYLKLGDPDESKLDKPKIKRKSRKKTVEKEEAEGSDERER